MKIIATATRKAQDIAPTFGGGHLDETTAVVVFEQASEEAELVVAGGEALPRDIAKELDYMVCQMGKTSGRLGVTGRKTGLWTFTAKTE